MDSLEEAVEFVKDKNLDEVWSSLEEDDDVTQASEFFTENGITEGLGWVECGEEGLMLIAPETSTWFELFQELSPDKESPSWDENVWADFDKLFENLSYNY